MGKAFSKVTPSNLGSPKSVDSEFDYRYKNTKTLRAVIKSLAKSVNSTNTAVMNTPARMVEVGEGYMAVNACMNHGSAGGPSQSSHTHKVAAVENADEGEDLNPTVSNSAQDGTRTRINRALAKETYDSAHAWSEAMRTLKENDYQTYRVSVEADVLKAAEAIIAKADATLALGKEASTAAGQHALAAKKVDDIESKCAKKGTEAANDKNYATAVTTRGEKEAVMTEKKDAFHESYEELMGSSQEFSIASMDRYLDLTVNYHKEFIRVIDSSGSPTKGRSVTRTGSGGETHEPTDKHDGL